MSEATCCQCPHRAAIIDHDTGKPWCLGCAVTLLRAGDPILAYTELAGGHEYARLLPKLSTQKLPFG